MLAALQALDLANTLQELEVQGVPQNLRQKTLTPSLQPPSGLSVRVFPHNLYGEEWLLAVRTESQ